MRVRIPSYITDYGNCVYRFAIGQCYIFIFTSFGRRFAKSRV